MAMEHSPEFLALEHLSNIMNIEIKDKYKDKDKEALFNVAYNVTDNISS